MHKILFLMSKVKVTIEDQRLVVYNRVSVITQKNNEENLIKLHRKIKQNEKVCRA